MRFWIGGWGQDNDGQAEGIVPLTAGDPDGALAGGVLALGGETVPCASPSWLARHPDRDVVYAAMEGAGTVQAFRRSGEATLAPLGDPIEAGEAVCHLAVAPDGAFLVASCYGDGRVVRIGLDAAGRPAGREVALAAADPYAAPVLDAALVAAGAAPGEGAAPADEPRPSRAHCAAFLPHGRMLSTDLGLDLVRIWRVSSAGMVADHEVVLPLGSGPRHAVLHPSGHVHVLTEHSGEVFTLAPDRAGRWRLIGGTPASAAALPSDAGAEIALSADGAFVYAGLRGSDTIAVLRVRDNGARLEPVALADAGVAWPRHHRILRDTVLVAGQRSHEIASLTLDERTGAPGRVRHRAATPSPTHILPAG